MPVDGYSLLRFFIAWGAFSAHGANVWVFGLVDVGTAWPYGKSVAVVCKRAAASDWKRLPLPLVVAVTTFFAPYAYLWFAAGEMPSGMRVGMTICVSVLLIAASAGVLAKTRKLRREAREQANAEAIVGVASAEGDGSAIIDLRARAAAADVVIDLTDDTVSAERTTH